MATDFFPQCLATALGEEGGYTNNPKDPGGVTNLGVTLTNWQHWLGKPVTPDDMHHLTPSAVAPFYRALYWQSASCDKLPAGLSLCVFDFAVNGGPGRAVIELQHTVGSPADGHAGVNTLLDTQKFVAAVGIAGAIKSYQLRRSAFYRSLPLFPTFGKGWLARTDRITSKALEMVK